MTIKLYSYWRSSAAYRVRIALNLKGVKYETVSVSLLPGESEHRQEAYRARNPQMLVPFREDVDFSSGQSMAILEYLEEAYPTPALLPESQQDCADVRSFCSSICCDIHPLNNLRVQLYLKRELGADDAAMHAWMTHWMHEGFRSAELTAATHDGPFVFGESVTIADACLIPQLYNAHRFDIPLQDFPTLVGIEAHCLGLPAFADAVPEQQPDAD